MIFLMPLAGAAIGAASGALGGALTDIGVNDQFMKDVAQTLQSDNAALFLLIRKMTTDKVLVDLQGVGGTVLRTSFAPPAPVADKWLQASERSVVSRHQEYRDWWTVFRDPVLNRLIETAYDQNLSGC